MIFDFDNLDESAGRFFTNPVIAQCGFMATTSPQRPEKIVHFDNVMTGLPGNYFECLNAKATDWLIRLKHLSLVDLLP